MGVGQAGPLGPAGVRRYTGEEVNKRTKDSHPLVSAEKDQKLGAASIAVAGEGPWGDWSGRPCRRGASPEQAWLASGTLDLGGFVPFPDRSSHDVETVAQTLWFVQNCSLRAGAWSCGVCQAEELSSKSPGHRGSGWVGGGSPGTALHTPSRPVVAGELGAPRVTPRGGVGAALEAWTRFPPSAAVPCLLGITPGCEHDSSESCESS